MFTTHSGCLGLSSDARTRDKIVVIVGCEVPAIFLRQNKDNVAFIVVDTYFIFGLMDGEAIERVREKEAKVEVFKIR